MTRWPVGLVTGLTTFRLVLAAHGETPRRTESLSWNSRADVRRDEEQIGHFRLRSNAIQAGVSAGRRQRTVRVAGARRQRASDSHHSGSCGWDGTDRAIAEERRRITESLRAMITRVRHNGPLETKE